MAFNLSDLMGPPLPGVVNWGIIGCANIAKKNVRSIALAKNAKLVAVASRSTERAAEWCAAEGLGSDVAALGSYDALLQRADVHAVYIPLPTQLHVEWAIKTAEAKKHILLEKPCAVNTEDLQKIVTACVKNGVQFMDGVMFMHHDRLRRIEQTLRGPLGYFGDVARVTSGFTFKGGKDFLATDIRCKKDGDPLGCIGDLGWYNIRMALVAWNWRLPHSVVARCNSRSSEGVPVDVDVTLFFNAEKTALATFHNSFLHVGRQWVEITGASKRLTLEDFVLTRNPSEATYAITHYPEGGNFIDNATRDASATEVVRVFDCCQEARLIENFSNLVLQGRLESFWPYITILTQMITDAAMSSAENDGKEIVLPPSPAASVYPA